MGNWLLPESLADILPAEARRIEELRRALLDLYRTYGFELVAPPLIEYIDSLLSGTGNDLNLRTFKLVDQLSGRTLGVRADMTPQVTRIDAHLLNRVGVTRLCYCGPVLHARPADLVSNRELLQIGAEIYGHAGVEADIEIIRLLLATVELAGVHAPHLVLCHLGVLDAILQADPVGARFGEQVVRLLRQKNIPGLAALSGVPDGLSVNTVSALQELAGCYGSSREVLDRAGEKLVAVPGVAEALDDLASVLEVLPEIDVALDLADVSGYVYHSRVSFALYAAGWHDALVRGGRYDDVSRAFGRARPATGFSLDLRKLAAGLVPARAQPAVRAPWGQEPKLLEVVHNLRRAGEVVIQTLPGHVPEQEEFIFDRELVPQDGTWIVTTL
jgi:ATP phosphoribosyltransferase regulatory subunit